MRNKVVLNALGAVLKYFGIVLFLPVIFALLIGETNQVMPFLTAAVVSLFCGFILLHKKAEDREMNDLRKSEALCVVFFSWVLFGLMCTIPYLFFKISLINSMFEAFSGITTTGATIITNFSLYPKTFYFFRAMTQWLGGMGVIVLFIAVLPKFAVAGRQMFFAEAPGPVDEKFTPRIRQTALWLWGIYIGLTVLEILLLYFVGKMDIYYSICTSLATVSSGGFMPDSESVALFANNKINWIIICFMFLAGCNFVLQYKVIIQRKIRIIFKNEEFWVYSGIIFFASSVIAYIICKYNGITPFQAITDAFFMVISAITTTGFANSNYNIWNIDAKAFLLAVMFVGGCASSTSGGVKVIRWIYVFKYLKKEIAKIIHPNAVYPIKLDGAIIAKDVRLQLIAFMIFYMVFFVLSSFIVCLIEKNPIVAISGSITTLGNIGLVIDNSLGVVDGIANLSILTKLIFIFNMVVGRLELIPFLALLHPDVWRKV